MRFTLLPLLLLWTNLGMVRAVRADEMNGLKSCVSAAGDVDGDGVPDLLVASRFDRAPQCVWVLSGKDGSVLMKTCGEEKSFGLASSMASCGDMNDDGRPDIVIAGSGETVTRALNGFDRACLGFRSARLVSGRTGAVLLEVPDVLYVGGVADVDGDGRADLIACVPAESGQRTTRVRVHSGRDGHVLYDLEPPPSPPTEQFGVSFANVGDIDGDGRDDFAIGAPSLDDSILGGHVYLFSGRDGVLIGSANADPFQDGFGWTLARIDDLDGDGHSEVLAGALHRCVDVLSGKDLHRLHRIDSVYRFAEADAFVSSLDVVGDVDGDCIPDWVVGANESLGDVFDEGYAWVISGRTGLVLRELFRSDSEGVDVCGIGDVDSDGVADVALSIEEQRIDDTPVRRARARPGERLHVVRAISGRTWRELWQVDVSSLWSRTIEKPSGK
jgi:hypothetical protein